MTDAALVETVPIDTTAQVTTAYRVRVGAQRGTDGNPAYTVTLDINGAPLAAAPLMLPVLPSTVFGLVYPPDDGTAHRAAFPDNTMIRVYNNPGGGIDGWDTPGLAAALPGQTVTVSFKDFPTGTVLAQLRALFGGIPEDCLKLRIVFRHEEHSAKIQEYKDGWNIVRDERDAHDNADRIELAENYMRYQIDEGGQNVDLYHPTRPDGSNTCDVMSVDCYSPQQLAGFLPAPTMFAHAVKLGAQYGMPVAILEVGGSVDASKANRTPADQARYIGDLATEAQRVGIVDVQWFSSNNGRYPYRLLDNPLAEQAWRSLQ